MANSRSGESVAQRIVRVLETFDADRTAQTASEIGRRAGLPSSTAHRLIAELVATGLLDRDEAGEVRLGMHLWEVAQRGSRALRLRQAALPFMQSVQARIREHTQLAVWEQDETLFLERLSHPDAVSNVARVAGRLPLHASSAGLVLLAFAEPDARERVLGRHLARVTPDTVTDRARLEELLADVRREGAVVARGFVEPVSAAVAVPVRERGRVIAALSVVLPVGAPVAGVRDELAAAAAGITRVLESDG